MTSNTEHLWRTTDKLVALHDTAQLRCVVVVVYLEDESLTAVFQCASGSPLQIVCDKNWRNSCLTCLGVDISARLYIEQLMHLTEILLRAIALLEVKLCATLCTGSHQIYISLVVLGVRSNLKHHVVEVEVIVLACILEGESPMLQRLVVFFLCCCLSRRLICWIRIRICVVRRIWVLNGRLVDVALSGFLCEERNHLLSTHVRECERHIIAIAITTIHCVVKTHEGEVVVDSKGAADALEVLSMIEGRLGVVG